MQTIGLVAVSLCLGSDQVVRQPGERWACPDAEADVLLARGAAELAPAGVPGGPDSDASLAIISGIGPATEAALETAGVRTLTDLATITDEGIAGLELDENIRRRIREDWRAQAAAMLDFS